MSLPRQPTGTLGAPRVHHRLTDSTNDRARELAAAAPHGTLVTAAEQSAGRGRQGRRWSAPAGSALLMSLILRSPTPLLPLAAAVALAEVAGPHALIKWPNDVVLATEEAPGLAKLAGILVEARLQAGWAVLGIGVNAAVRLEDLPEELRRPSREPGAPLPAATLGLEPEQLEPLLQDLLLALQQRLAEPASLTLAAWRARDALLGRELTWAEGAGTARGIDGEGRLVVERDDGRLMTLAAGEVHLRMLL